MDKFRNWAKKPVNTNLIIFMGIALFLIAFAAYSYKSQSRTTELLNNLGGILNNMKNEETDGAKGYGIILGTIAHGIGVAGNSLIIFLLTGIPLYMAVVTIVQTVFTRFLYHPKSPSRILCYRISMAFCCITFIFHIIIFSMLVFNFYSGLHTILIDAVMGVAFVVCLRNTYSKRIKIYDCSQEEKTVTAEERTMK